MISNGAIADNPLAHLPARVRQLRDGRDWSQDALARQAGVSIRVVQQLEQGRSATITLLSAVRLAAALGVSVDALIAIPAAETRRKARAGR